MTGIVYKNSRNFGSFVAVDSIYSALIPRRAISRQPAERETISAIITDVKPDGKLDLALCEDEAGAAPEAKP